MKAYKQSYSIYLLVSKTGAVRLIDVETLTIKTMPNSSTLAVTGQKLEEHYNLTDEVELVLLGAPALATVLQWMYP